MPLPRFSTLDPERRAAILSAAAEEFARAGLQGASYNRIIARAGVSKGAMYYYFDNKEDLFVTVVADLAERAAAAIGGPGPFSDAAGFWQQMRSLCARALQFFADPTLAGLYKQLVTPGRDSPLGHAVEEHTRRLEAYTAELLRAGQQVGAVRTDLPIELLAHLLTGLGEAFDRWLLTRWESLRPAELAALPDQIVDLFARLAAPGAPAPPVPKPRNKKP
jgi:AcrR family transcriptional regulator